MRQSTLLRLLQVILNCNSRHYFYKIGKKSSLSGLSAQTSFVPQLNALSVLLIFFRHETLIVADFSPKINRQCATSPAFHIFPATTDNPSPTLCFVTLRW